MASERRTEPKGKAAMGSPIIASGFYGTHRGRGREAFAKRSGNTAYESVFLREGGLFIVLLKSFD
ncbi:MAG: hypothetical protein E7285_07340 [Lachnospiraceae bacterium]|nr:hypothetical protein [Lachnospiraceae bacterium]